MDGVVATKVPNETHRMEPSDKETRETGAKTGVDSLPRSMGGIPSV